jgi:hypothetical protein
MTRILEERLTRAVQFTPIKLRPIRPRVPLIVLLGACLLACAGKASAQTNTFYGSFAGPFDNSSIPNATGGDGTDIGAFEFGAHSARSSTSRDLKTQ